MRYLKNFKKYSINENDNLSEETIYKLAIDQMFKILEDKNLNIKLYDMIAIINDLMYSIYYPDYKLNAPTESWLGKETTEEFKKWISEIKESKDKDKLFNYFLKTKLPEFIETYNSGKTDKIKFIGQF
jgi:hypothetical protein